MAKTLNLIRAFCIIAALLGAGVVAVFSQPNMLSARIGILIDSGELSTRARGQERIKAGDRLRIYVRSEEACHVYVVHTDHKMATLLGAFEAMSPGAQIVLPGLLEFYEVDGESPVEAFTIICSTVKLNDISDLFNSKVTYENWAPMEEKLLKQGKIDLSQKPDKPSPIAGNVRELTGSNKDDSFIRELPIYSGNTILVKRYEFDIKK
jgi:hypothetical protein